ncbi:unnamed protein product [Spirodela intermedia]|uniref:Uncharacterized protein n=1 Tax=Spirodela intermedia TaxID=51605 RepID=A0A7I8JKQ3_SPIIN|nr:unnamed protein product [Spirodela intermedia]CAA6670767.1 unnamed protein product [Spirodela intermedia]
MAEAVLSYVVKRAGDFLIDQAFFLYEVKDQVEWVTHELRAMECFLKDADVRDVRKVAYRAEDLVESFVLDAQRRQRWSESFIRSTVRCLSVSSDLVVLHQFGKEIEAIRAQIYDINERRDIYGIQNLGGEPRRQVDETVQERRRAALHAADADMVGMDEEVNRILGHLLDESRKKRSVISIVGMGGLGKTTLAKRVFNRATADFIYSAWRDVSQQYSAVDLIGNLLLQVTGLEEEDLGKMTRAKREEKLYQTIEGKKYLIVMDDVWDGKVWRILSPHLPEAENGSRLLITTRSVDVARAADPGTPPFELQLLSEEEIWELLSKAFSNKEDIDVVCSEQLREVGKQIVRKCRGLPLALVVISGLLSTKGPSLRECRRLAQTLVWENIDDGRLCLDILALSHADLPHHLKWLEEILYQTIQGKKYLIVMDDVWDTEIWRILSPHLPDAENGSRVLITTRSIDVARAADPSIPPCELRSLTEEESWQLLSKKAFPNQEDIEAVCSEPLREVGKQIAKKCGGLPLALVVLGGLLSTKGPSLREWRRLAETIVWENIKEGRLCLDILALSYEDLPHQLKWCFLYFSSFPQDFKIGVKKLIRLWSAEGFVEHRAGETLEESAEGHFQELVRRCMVTIVQNEYDSPMAEGRQRCRIHDLLHDFAIAEAKKVGFLVCRQIPDDRDASRLDSSLRCLSLNGVAVDYVSHVKHSPRVRTLLWFNVQQRKVIRFPTGALKLLRVIDLEEAPLAVLPKQVGDLIHLRFLGLRGTRLRSLPSSVGKLRHLQSLDVLGTSIKTMPRAVWKIDALRHVHVPDELEPEMVEAGLRNLQVLMFVRAGSWIDSCLGTLTSLRELGLTGIQGCHHRALLSSLSNLSPLKKLKLEGVSIPPYLWTPSSFSSLEFLYLKGEMARPQPPRSAGARWPLNLTELILWGTRLDQDSIATLENLPELIYLYLDHGSYAGNEMICSPGGFSQLQCLVLNSLAELERWVAEAGAMSRLRSLTISRCRKLVMLPEGLQDMTDLKDLTLRYMPPEFCSRAQKEGEDWPKIRHIPSVTLL